MLRCDQILKHVHSFVILLCLLGGRKAWPRCLCAKKFEKKRKHDVRKSRQREYRRGKLSEKLSNSGIANQEKNDKSAGSDAEELELVDPAGLGAVRRILVGRRGAVAEAELQVEGHLGRCHAEGLRGRARAA